MNAVRLRADWRPLMGLVSEDQGTLVERVVARTVIAEAVASHNEDVRRANQKSSRG